MLGFKKCLFSMDILCPVKDGYPAVADHGGRYEMT